MQAAANHFEARYPLGTVMPLSKPRAPIAQVREPAATAVTTLIAKGDNDACVSAGFGRTRMRVQQDKAVRRLSHLTGAREMT
jgi:hypothetical protein